MTDTVALNPLEMPDEDILNMETPAAADVSEPPAASAAEGVEDAEVDVADTANAEASEEETAEEQSEDNTSDTEETSAEDNTEEEKPAEDNKSDEPDTDYKAMMEQLFAPFKANGREMKVDSIDDALTLMKMGANYNKKMAALKPGLKVLKMLENNSLLDEERLSYLIDLDKKNPEAIARLIKESGIDPLDVNTEGAEEYKPNSYTVNEREMELDSVLDEIQETPSYNETIDIISNKWDSSSRQTLADNPQIIKVINEHVQNGIYAQISKVIEQERVLGRINGLSDLEAYKAVGDRLHAEGAFKPAPVANEPNIPDQKVQPPVNQPDPKIKDRKRAAAPTKSAPVKKAVTDFNPLALSDDDFDKLVSSKFL